LICDGEQNGYPAKQHQKIESLQATLAEEQKQIATLAAGLKKLSHPAPDRTTPARITAHN